MNNKASALRYKKSALASLGYDSIVEELYEIQEACSDIRWFVDQGDETLLNAMDGDEDDLFEFKMAFADLDASSEHLLGQIGDWAVRDEFDTCTVALIGNRYSILGFDCVEEDYYSLCGYDSQLAYSEAGKRLMRKTKAEMISTIGQCLGILITFLNVRQRYDYLKATFDILRDENTSLLRQIKEIDKTYAEAEAVGFQEWCEETRTFERLLACLPDRVWIE